MLVWVTKKHISMARLPKTGVADGNAMLVGLLFLSFSYTTEPTVGVLTYPSHDPTACDAPSAVCAAARSARRQAPDTSYIDSSYKYWLEAAGARVVPIRYDLDEPSVRALFGKVNAVLFTGGPSKPLDAPKPYFSTATLLYNLGVSEGIPVWGTCLGLQTIACIAAGGSDVLGSFPLENYAYPLDFTAAAATSKLFGDLSAAVRPARSPLILPPLLSHLLTLPPLVTSHSPTLAALIFQRRQELADFGENVTTNWHNFGVAPSALKAMRLVPTATNVALNGKTFVSALEGEGDSPVVAVQFHPESVAWQAPSGGVPAKSAAALRTAQYLARFLVERARTNSHAFASTAELAASLMERQGNFTPSDPHSLYPGDGSYIFSAARRTVEDVPPPTLAPATTMAHTTTARATTAAATTADAPTARPQHDDGVSWTTGYVPVDKGSIFYAFFPHANPHAPLAIWLQGGPGASGIQDGLLTIHGPLQLDANGSKLVRRPVSWASEFAMLYVDSPVGTGYSYATNASDLRSYAATSYPEASHMLTQLLDTMYAPSAHTARLGPLA
jgi:gamma-glutamyl hydrolase